MFRRRRGFRRGEAVTILVGATLIGLLGFAFRKKPKLSAGQQINVLRMRIVATARNIKEAHELKILDDAAYKGAREKVVNASKRFNTLVRRYKQYGTFARSEKQQVVALLIAALKTTREVVRRGKVRKDPR